MKRKHPACQRRWLCPVDPLDLTGLENWLTECSEQGLHFAQYVPLPLFPYWRFACGEPQTLRYRLEPIQRKGPQSPDPEQTAYYRACGWDYRGSIGRLFHVYAAGDPASPELHTDPVSQSFTLEILARRCRWDLYLLLGLLALEVLVTFAYPLLTPGSGALTRLFTGGYRLAPFVTPVILLLLYALYRSGYTRFRRLRQQLEAGIPMEHRDKHYKERSIRLAVLVLILINMFLRPVSLITAGDPVEPHQLSDVPLFSLDAPRESDGCRITEHTFVLSRRLTVQCTGYLPNAPEAGALTLRYTCYGMRLPFFASPLLEDLAQSTLPESGASTELALPGLERAILCQSPGPEGARQELFLQTGSWVIHVESCTFDLQLYAEALCEQLSTL